MEGMMGRTTHGNAIRKQRTPEFNAWANMIQRCTNPRCPEFKRYGAVGIRICARWQEFANFLADVGPRPSAEHSLDRFPNNNGNYEPGNVRWATAAEQQANLRTN